MVLSLKIPINYLRRDKKHSDRAWGSSAVIFSESHMISKLERPSEISWSVLSLDG